MVEKQPKVIDSIPIVEERKHAILSASGSKIWLECTPSARFGEEFPDEETEYSREGVWAHSVANFRLEDFLGRKHAEYQKERDIPGDEFRSAANNEAINAYVRRCIIAIGAARRDTPEAIVLLEQRLDFSDWVPEGFGTGDLVIVADRVLRVRDLKFGKGVRVDAEDNTQLWLYALGAIAAYRGVYDFGKVIVEIDQPRLNHVDGGDIEIDVAEIVEWASSYLQPRAELAWGGKGEFKPGDWCRWCRARAVCKARAAHLNDLVDAAFEADDAGALEAPQKRLTDEEIVAFLPRLKMLAKWAKDMEEYTLAQAVKAGKKWDGYKLVEGRSNRVITDPSGLAEVLMMEGVEEAMIYEPPAERSLLGLGELEKLVGKSSFAELAKGYIKKPPGKPTLVPAADKRDEWTPSDADGDFDAE
jgi:hypothetical protein